MRALAFPMRLQENGLLQRQDRTQSILDLLHVMARTPAGSWPGSSTFGLRDLFETRELRGDVLRMAMQRINGTFKELGLGEFTVTDVSREPSAQAGVDQYSITIESSVSDERIMTSVSREM